MAFNLCLFCHGWRESREDFSERSAETGFKSGKQSPRMLSGQSSGLGYTIIRLRHTTGCMSAGVRFDCT